MSVLEAALRRLPARALASRLPTRSPTAAGIAAVLLVVTPFVLSSYWTYVVTLGLVFAIVTLSLVVLTGWVGQVSLAQASFMGIGAYVSVTLGEHFGFPFWLSVPLGALATVPATILMGFVALRLRGFYLAAATVSFALMVQRFLFQWRWLTGGNEGYPAPKPGLGFVSLTSDMGYYFLVAAVAAGVALLAVNLRDSAAGRAFFAIRTSETAAQSLGIQVTRYKLLAFVLSGLIAGLGGALFASLVGRLSPQAFDVGPSILYLAIALLGGLEFVAGAFAGGVLFALLPEVARALEISGNWLSLTLAVMMLLTISFAPRGMIGNLVRARRDGGGGHAGPLDAEAFDELLAVWGELPEPPPLALEDAVVRFGGVVALDHADVQVVPGQVTGLIGPNGAGKTTALNVLTGFIPPTEGHARLGGDLLDALAPEDRAARGLVRTFQTPLLFSGDTVLGNLVTAAHLRAEAGLVADLLGTRAARSETEAAEQQARLILRFLGLSELADAPVRGLPFGAQRLVELARGLMVRPRVLLLDEPAAGLSGAETAKLAEILGVLNRSAGMSVLLVEHDVELVMAVADAIFVLDFGRVIAHGAPAEVRADPAVRKAYLGHEDETRTGVAVG